MRVTPLLPLVVFACSGSTKKVEPTNEPSGGLTAYIMDSGTFEGAGMIRTEGHQLPWSIKIERTCDDRAACKTRFTRTVGKDSSSYVSHTEVRATGEYEVYFKDDKRERTDESLRIPSPDRLPHEWTKPGAEDQMSACKATRDETACAGGIRLYCETPATETAVVTDVRVLCPDKAKTLRRHVGTYTTLCEQLMDVSYTSWRGEAMDGSAALATAPGCDRFSPLGWTRQTPNRDWSVAMPAQGRMVVGPEKWTVNLHQADMSYIAYEGTGANANVKSDADIPAMAQYMGETVAPLLGATVGEPKKREGPHPTDWEIPLTKDGKFAGTLRLIGRDGVMYSLMASGSNRELATVFIESFSLHDAGFGATAARKYDDYLTAGAAYKDKVCACDTLACARNVPELTAPTPGFPSPDQEKTLGELAAAINDCASKLATQP